MFSLPDSSRRAFYFRENGAAKYVIVFLLVGGMWGGACLHSSVLAQQDQPSPYFDHRSEKQASYSPAPSRSGQVEKLPDWAEPSNSFSRGGSSASSRTGASPSGGFRTKNHGGKHPVPVEGGVIWLFIAGVSYGAFRLGWKKSAHAR